jgi:2-polyprenyl-3-methyl-5-hydroxy-6-metoxy-1,4-benzoquinol methylase
MIDFCMNRRRVSGEIMDAPGLDPAAHQAALAGLRRINRASGTAAHLLVPLLKLAREAGLDHLTLLDVACGGGDVPVELARRAQGAGVRVDLLLMDRSETAVRTAVEAGRRAGVACRGIVADVTDGPVLGSGGVDVVTNSLFLHHLAHGSGVSAVLGRLDRMAGLGVLISDLQRSRLGWVAAWIGCRLLSRSPIVHYDGPASVRAAWTIKEMRSLAEGAGVPSARIERCHPLRMLITWRTS